MNTHGSNRKGYGDLVNKDGTKKSKRGKGKNSNEKKDAMAVTNQLLSQQVAKGKLTKTNEVPDKDNRKIIVKGGKTNGSNKEMNEASTSGLAKCTENSVARSTSSNNNASNGRSRISQRRGRQLSGGAPTYNFAKFSQKLHEIERIWTPRGGAHPKFYYVDPPLASIQQIKDLNRDLKLLNKVGLLPRLQKEAEHFDLDESFQFRLHEPDKVNLFPEGNPVLITDNLESFDESSSENEETVVPVEDQRTVVLPVKLREDQRKEN